MANVLNRFKTYSYSLTTTPTVQYTAPSGYTGVILLSQATNVISSTADITFLLRDNSGSSSVDTELVKGFSIPEGDASSILTGKLVIEEGNAIVAFTSIDDSIKFTISVLESLNES